MPAFLNPAEAEAWVLAGLLIFLGVVIFVAPWRELGHFAPGERGGALEFLLGGVLQVSVSIDAGHAGPRTEIQRWRVGRPSSSRLRTRPHRWRRKWGRPGSGVPDTSPRC